jgi:hypothetical protein
MRYLLAFLCVCALGVMPVVGCSDGGPSTIGSVFPTIDTVMIVNNLWYSWGRSEDHEYGVDIEALTVAYNADTITTADVTPDAMHMLVQTIQGAVYRVNDICGIYLLDSGILPPKIVIRQGAEHGTFSVSDSDCARLPHNQGLPVIGCDDYNEIFRQLADMAGHFYPNDWFWCSDLW